LTNFINVFRAEVGKEEYRDTAQRKVTLGFLDILQKLADDFVEESRDALRALGFEKTPWDDMDKSSA
jgi:hypothetical protein